MAAGRARIRKFVEATEERLRADARRASTFDHKGNRGTESEHSISAWLGRRFMPSYTVSAGEIIDSFDTSATRASRQQDCVLHEIGIDRFLFPSGMRLIPIERVVAVIEVKRRLTQKEFRESDQKATGTSELRFAVMGGSTPRSAVGRVRGTSEVNSPLGEEDLSTGLACNDPRLRPNRPIFAVFGFGGPKTPETLAGWMRDAKTIDVVCCLGGGCISRDLAHPDFGRVPGSLVSQAEDALPMFEHYLSNAVDRYEGLRRFLHFNLAGYAGFLQSPMLYWDETNSYEPPAWYKPTAEDLAQRGQLYARRPGLRPRPRKKR